MTQTPSTHPVERRHTDPEFSRKLDTSLRACIKEGVAAQVMIGIFDYYLIPLALLLRASTWQIGFLVSVPHLLSAALQLFAVNAIEMAGSRKRFVLKGIAVQLLALFLIPLLAVVYFPHNIIFLLFLITVFRVLGSIIGPAWGSIVSDYLPDNRRGSYFGRRAQIIGVSGILAVGFWGLFMSVMNKVSEAWGLFAVFLSAAVCRVLSMFYMNQMVEMPHKSHEDDYFSFWMFVRRLKESNFMKFVLYVSSITFATQLSAAYFSVYMLNDLKFGYLSYMGVHLASLLAGLISFPIWGRHADVVGNAKVLKLTSFLIPLVPLLWMFWDHPLALIAIELFGGFVWGGFTLCHANFIYDAVRPTKRVRCLGYFNLINSVALFAGASLGGFLAYRLPSIGDKSPLVTLFLLSAVVRLAAHFLLSKHFQEVRESYQKVSSMELFTSVLGVRPLTGENIEWGIFPLLKRFIMRRT
jgi:MFS family permease